MNICVQIMQTSGWINGWERNFWAVLCFYTHFCRCSFHWDCLEIPKSTLENTVILTASAPNPWPQGIFPFTQVSCSFYLWVSFGFQWVCYSFRCCCKFPVIPMNLFLNLECSSLFYRETVALFFNYCIHAVYIFLCVEPRCWPQGLPQPTTTLIFDIEPNVCQFL